MNYKFSTSLLLASLVSVCITPLYAGQSKTVPPLPTQVTIAPGIFKPEWASLTANYQVPEWFRDAKFGIWAHWSAQCVPEQGDWYARNMYIEDNWMYKSHVARYGHPSKVGFKDIDNMWHTENWDPDKLMKLYKDAGAKYFMALANHHDNFDCYDSKWQPWNSMNMGPHKDIVGIWAKTTRKYGMRFGVSNHSSHAWHWLQVAYGHDTSGPYKDIPYDGYLTRADGKGTWWEGYDPQDLYCGLRIPPPSDKSDVAAIKDWRDNKTREWHEDIPTADNGYSEKWFLRCQDLVDKYRPDLLYFDDTSLPLDKYGLDIAAHFYNANTNWHHGHNEAVVTAKMISDDHKAGLVDDYERGASGDIQKYPWQTDTCIGQWHYAKGIQYKSVDTVVKMLVNIVSKNGNLMLNIPVRGDGSIDDQEIAFLKDLAKWMKVNGEGIFSTRPWKIYGEGSQEASGMFNEWKQQYSSGDIRYTQSKNGKVLYAFFLGWPPDGKLNIRSLGTGDAAKPALLDKAIGKLTLLGSKEKVNWKRDADGLHVTMPTTQPCASVYTLKLALK